MLKVYIINFGPHMNESLMQLEKDGYQFIKLTEGNVDVFGTDRLRYDIEKIFRDTGITKDDFLVLSGSPVISCIATGLMMLMTGQVNFMIYGAKLKDYSKRENIIQHELPEQCRLK
jgi:hypothetical protein